MIERFNSRRLELVSKGYDNLSSKEKKELKLLERCVDHYIEVHQPKARLDGLSRLMSKIKEVYVELQ
jgi:hypothetical protein